MYLLKNVILSRRHIWLDKHCAETFLIQEHIWWYSIVSQNLMVFYIFRRYYNSTCVIEKFIIKTKLTITTKNCERFFVFVFCCQMSKWQNIESKADIIIELDFATMKLDKTTRVLSTFFFIGYGGIGRCETCREYRDIKLQ